MSHSRTHQHTHKPPRTERQADQRRIAQQRRNEKTLRERYEADDRVPDADDARDHHLDGPRCRP